MSIAMICKNRALQYFETISEIFIKEITMNLVPDNNENPQNSTQGNLIYKLYISMSAFPFHWVFIKQEFA